MPLRTDPVRSLPSIIGSDCMSVYRSLLATLALASLGAAPVSSTQSPASFPTAEMMTVGVYLLPGGLAARAVGARFREYQETRIRVRAHGGIRLGVHGTTGGAVRLRVARARGSPGRGPGAEGRPLHAFRHASRVAHPGAPGNVDDRCARPADEPRVTRARHLELAGLPSICRANRDRAWQAIRTQPERVWAGRSTTN